MSTLQVVSLAVLAALLAGAVASDLRSRRIPNTLVVAGFMLGIASQVLAPVPGVDGRLTGGLVGATLALLLFLPFYALRVMGAGDVKLLAMVGAWLGAGGVLWAALFTLMAGGTLALGVAIATGELRRVLQNLWFMLASTSMRLHGAPPAGPTPTTGRLPYAIAIAAGTAIEVWRLCGAGTLVPWAV